jgi:hypothetical protein
VFHGIPKNTSSYPVVGRLYDGRMATSHWAKHWRFQLINPNVDEVERLRQAIKNDATIQYLAFAFVVDPGHDILQINISCSSSPENHMRS